MPELFDSPYISTSSINDNHQHKHKGKNLLKMFSFIQERNFKVRRVKAIRCCIISNHKPFIVRLSLTLYFAKSKARESMVAKLKLKGAWDWIHNNVCTLWILKKFCERAALRLETPRHCEVRLVFFLTNICWTGNSCSLAYSWIWLRT